MSGKTHGTPVRDLHKKWIRSRPGYREAYNELETEYRLAEALIAARARAGLSQEELANRMNTKQAAIARLESGRNLPSTRTLQRFADATGTRLAISFESVKPPRKRATGSPAERSR